ncbi:MAG: MmcQ/YjbR family DNA-binding protein [Arachidicoccus sp.]|nr:MmcQ/YjbR family DNA-binding protein [Arachidicoccus sp.]
MYLDDIRDFALSLKDAEECFPFGEETFVYKVNNKIFLLIGFDDNQMRLNVKCNPEEAIELRERYAYIIPGYHMNKKHWNTILIDNGADKKIVLDSIEKSYELVKGRKK